MKKILLKIIGFLFPGYLWKSTSYAQDGEDMLLKAFYEGRKGYKGFYIDVGAHHPYRFSNTAYFYKKGWRGINIEPTPALIADFRRLRKRDINLNIGVSDEHAKVTFYGFNEPALNSFDKELSLARENGKYKIISQQEIEVFPLGEVLDRYLPANQGIDFLTIDVEGLDFNVLKSNDWNKYIPLFILIEEKFCPEHLVQNSIYSFLKEKGYKLAGRTQRTSLFQYYG